MSVGIEQNNPGDIRCSVNNVWKGQLLSDSPFCKFDTMEHGIRAIAILLINGQQCGEPPRRTIREICTHYAPPTENNTATYIQTCVDHTGYDADEVMNMTNEDELISMVRAIIEAEQGAESRQITGDQVEAGVIMALTDMALLPKS